MIFRCPSPFFRPRLPHPLTLGVHDRNRKQGVNMFTFPHVKPIWIRYLERFVERYGGSKLERARDLFEQVTT